jgi:hypothetical protein
MFLLLRHPSENKAVQLARKYVKTSSQVTVQHLCKYLALKLGFNYLDFSIYPLVTSPKLDQSVTLASIQRQVRCHTPPRSFFFFLILHRVSHILSHQYWKGEKDPTARVLFYRIES